MKRIFKHRLSLSLSHTHTYTILSLFVEPILCHVCTFSLCRHKYVMYTSKLNMTNIHWKKHYLSSVSAANTHDQIRYKNCSSVVYFGKRACRLMSVLSCLVLCNGTRHSPFIYEIAFKVMVTL